MKFIAFSLPLLVAACASLQKPAPPPTSSATVVTYPAPTGPNSIPLSSAFSVTAGGKRVDVYQVKVAPQYVGYNPCPSTNEIASMAYFDFSGTVNLQVTSAAPISSVAIRPLRHGIVPTISGNTISFSLSKPVNLSIEINGDDRHNLHLFANPLEVNKPSPTDSNVQYYGPGVYGDGSPIKVQAGKTLYISGGAIIYGTFYIEGVSGGGDATIRGRGIVSGEKTNIVCVRGGGNSMVTTLNPYNRFSAVYNGANNLNLEGFIALDSPADWNFVIFNVNNFTADNIKAITWRGNGDGLALISVSSAMVKNVFIRDTDDTMEVKADPYYFFGGNFTPSNRASENITIEDSVAWADGAGHAIAFNEHGTPLIRNVQMRNIDIVHTYVTPVYMGCCGSPSEQYNITLDDIRVEDMKSSDNMFLINTNRNGNIHDVYINNFSVLGGNITPSTISGADSTHRVYNVTFNNLKYLESTITSAAAGQFNIGSFTSNIKFTTGGTVTTSTYLAPSLAPSQELQRDR